MRLCPTAFILTLLLLTNSLHAQVIYSETFDDGDASMRWSTPIVEAELGTFDGTLDYAYDYSALGVPAAPNSGGTTTGLFMNVNTSQDGDVDEGESVGILASDLALPADFVLTMDVYFNVNNLTNTDTGTSPGGTTEYGLFGVFASGALTPDDAAVNDDIPFRFNLSNGDGLAWSATGEGGASDDVIRFEDAGNAGTGSQVGLGSYDDIPNGTIPGVPTGAGDPLNPFAFGPEDQWVEMSITSAGGMVSFAMNGYVFDTFDNSAGAFSGGTIMLGYSDPFNSVNEDVGVEAPNFLLIDNVTVAIPEPSSFGLATIMLVGLFTARRRRR